MQRTDHEGMLAIRQRDDHALADDSRVLGMLDPKNLTAAAMNLKGAERHARQKMSHLFKHGAKLRCPWASGKPPATRFKPWPREPLVRTSHIQARERKRPRLSLGKKRAAAMIVTARARRG
jgi:hypothetical protein